MIVSGHRPFAMLYHSLFLLGTSSCYNERNEKCGEMVMQYEQPLKILILAAEIVPFVKVGGLADVVGALPKALRALGHDVRLVMPRYGQIEPERFGLSTVLDKLSVDMATFREPVSVRQGSVGEGIPVYMIDAPRYFDREHI